MKHMYMCIYSSKNWLQTTGNLPASQSKHEPPRKYCPSTQFSVGDMVGVEDGYRVGGNVGSLVGEGVGTCEGRGVGVKVGLGVGLKLGSKDSVGCIVGTLKNL
jgi:hypothetical protein